MSEPLIDVILPAYNAAGTLRDSVISLQAQTERRFRIIIVDDGSTDRTGEVIEALAADDPRILVITTENCGIVDALNTALGAVAAPFVARLDADDICFPNRFQNQLAYLADHPDCVAVGCNVWHIDETGERTGGRSTFLEQVTSDPYWAPCVEPYLMHPFLMARTKAIRDIGGYRYAFHAEDTDLYWRLAGMGRLHNLPDLLGEYRMHTKSISGASVINGRISAINSQLSAISERRRRAGEPDIIFPREALRQYEDAGETEAMVDLASRQLTKPERGYLEVATAAKLLQLSSFRPYSLNKADRCFIKAAIARNHRLLRRENKIKLLLRHIAAHRLKRRKFGELMELTSPKLLLSAALDLPGFLFGMARSTR
jgi:glycosyltransferase involved in cell wall biosynthesis